MRREEERCKANNDVHSLGWEIALLLCVEAAGRLVLRRPLKQHRLGAQHLIAPCGRT
ncbi:hypothetical protein MSIMFB_05209 [Mycobacterium simulans]|uniref:Uncharacterized protein n=1 Tax=Mycobacterium simulans TaxID=627089 RepID=A0A7Z7ND20_9MYCO|nr:hypothetical protein MSIMFB_05209 [Mycobacterium simulans]